MCYTLTQSTKEDQKVSTQPKRIQQITQYQKALDGDLECGQGKESKIEIEK